MKTNLKTYLIKSISILVFFLTTQNGFSQSDIVNKVTVGYQAWFNCYGDGSPVASWRHWSNGVYGSNDLAPAPNNVNIELYPDIKQYDPKDLFQTNLGNLGDNSSSKLFSSYSETTIDLHFKWMKENEIDGVALQRFMTETFWEGFKQQRNSIASRVKIAAEKYDRTFYIMYDLAGLEGDKMLLLKDDWQKTMLEDLKITDSDAYARHNGKPIIAIWGIGFTHININKDQALELIRWLQSLGYYVIAGVPGQWRTNDGDSKTNFQEVYQELDMLSPWTVGRYNDVGAIDSWFDTRILPDKQRCDSWGVDYLPVVFPGFAWSNWNGGERNAFPRLGGDFMWRQAYNLGKANIASAYIAMFDEYDEATAIAPAADSYFSVPNDQYFLTNSADGIYRSSDFYLRLTGEIGKMIKKQIPYSPSFNTPPSIGPVFFRSSFEDDYDAMPNWTNTIEQTTTQTNTNCICEVTTAEASIGKTAIKIAGWDNSVSESQCYFKVFDVNIPIYEDTYLTYDIFPKNESSRYTGVDLIMTDGTNIRDIQTFDTNGINMHPGYPRGVIYNWTTISSNIGKKAYGKTIDRIVIAYDQRANSGHFESIIDNLQITRGNSDIVTKSSNPFSKSLATEDSKPFTIYYNEPGTNDIMLEIMNESDILKSPSYSVYDFKGKRKIDKKKITNTKTRIEKNTMNSGIYILEVNIGKRSHRQIVTFIE